MVGELTQGQLLIYLREKVLNKNQTEFAKLMKVSRRTIINIENDDGPFRESIINKVFKPFGIKSGLVPSSPDIGRELLSISKLDSL
jgi:DNA-binding XRE family transcriptional regulator